MTRRFERLLAASDVNQDEGGSWSAVSAFIADAARVGMLKVVCVELVYLYDVICVYICDINHSVLLSALRQGVCCVEVFLVRSVAPATEGTCMASFTTCNVGLILILSFTVFYPFSPLWFVLS